MRAALLGVLCVLVVNFAAARQEADANFVPKVAHPAYGDRHPKVLFDEAHFNFHTTSGRYKPFVELICESLGDFLLESSYTLANRVAERAGNLRKNLGDEAPESKTNTGSHNVSHVSHQGLSTVA